MEKIISFIFEHYEVVILAAACLLDVILFLVGVFRKKDHSVLDQVIFMLPVFIKQAEVRFGAGHGSDKLKYALSLALDHYYNLSGVTIKESSAYSKVISKHIESILETPTKKGK